jgi:coenzyme Q-binding protein COQ10
MHLHRETRVLPYSPEQVFDLVADVGRYPEFLPWVIAARVRSSTPAKLVADLVVGFKVLRETFTSEVNLDRPRRIHVNYLSGPLRTLENDWQFTLADDGRSTRVDFCVQFAFRNAMFQRIAGAVFTEAFHLMVRAFERRAEQLYGASPASGGISSESANSVA